MMNCFAATYGEIKIHKMWDWGKWNRKDYSPHTEGINVMTQKLIQVWMLHFHRLELLVVISKQLKEKHKRMLN